MGTKGTWPRRVNHDKYEKNFPFPDRLFKKEIEDVAIESGLGTLKYGIVDPTIAISAISILSRHLGTRVIVVAGDSGAEIYQACWDAYRGSEE